MRNVKLTTSIVAVAMMGAIGAGAAWAGIADSEHNMQDHIGTPVEATSGDLLCGLLFDEACVGGEPLYWDGTDPATVSTDAGLATQFTGTNGFDNGEICVYCHTPHGAADTNPLWNRPDSGVSFTNYASMSMDGAAASLGSISLACLSCHDGTQARDTVINAPGMKTAAGDDGRMMTLGAMSGFAAVGAGGDLSDDHPIGIQYAAGGYTVSSPTVTDSGDFGDADFNLANTDVIAGLQRWWVEDDATTLAVGTQGTREKTDMILYTSGSAGTDEPMVECGSCHDPHNTSTEIEVGDRSTQVAFLRTSNAGSVICLTCHAK